MTAQEDPYVRVYYRALTDQKFCGLSSSAWGHWVRLLVVADGLYPAPAPLPRWVEDAPLTELVAAGIVDREGLDYYRIHGMKAEREGRIDAATFAADVKHHGRPEAERRRAERLRAHADAVHPDAGAAPGAADLPPGLPLRSSPLLSSPNQAAPSRATDQRYGLPHITEVSQSVAESITGMGILTAGEKQLTEWDRLVEFHGEAKVAEAFRRVAKGKRVTYRQLVWDTVKDLEPFAKPTVIEGAKKDEASEADWEARVAATRRETDWIRRHMYPEETDDAA